ncbi:MAG: zinc-dependent metalloprotease [Gracilimonas sp.]|uniref:zinc-dependent metalloprotease n=1 Tax=Gracilimonas sp. TaxID=1974203 RepID=UPI001B16F1D9|nr:zinc-dependent metalloprotease [Gracilimonas sp.]MBO6584565.1 zinc-dependent metalloprotease [Gracilimonas sp.]MBO6616164.1 zinc-dependent metalloprotease [Gracilimonas sp.]
MKKILLFLSLIVLVPAWANAQKGDKDKKEEDKFTELTKDAEHIEGFFDLYKTDDALYLTVTEEQLNNDFLMNFEIEQGIGSSGLYGGTMLSVFEGLLVRLEKQEGKLMLVQKPHRYVAEEGTPEAVSVELGYGNSILETAKVETTNDDGVMLVNVYDWFVGDLSNIGQRVSFVVSSRPGQPGRASFDKSRSYLKAVKSFPMNTNVTAQLTFNNSELGGPRTVADSRYIPVSIHYTMAELPEEPMSPRMADDRTGFFMTVHKDFTDDDDDTFFKRYVNKWRLECDGAPGADGLCDPVEPITYYIDHTVPEAYREAMMEGVEEWSKAFEAAGFRDAVQAEMLPEGVEPEDIRYATLRWNVSDQPGYGAIGPSVVDPRTGEILDADILFEANMILGDKEEYREMVEPRAAIDEIYNVSAEEVAMSSRSEMKSFYTEMAMQLDMVKGLLVARGQIASNDPVPKEFTDQALRWVTMHEVGHTLGLRHNFRSSVDTPLDKLYDTEWTEENGVFSSTMDYPTVNLSPQGEDNDGHYYNTSVGSYDRWVISYGYTPDDEKAAEIARMAAQPGHAYGTDEDARGSGAIDPHVNVYDLGADPLAWGKGRAALLRDLIPEVPEIALADNMPYYEATDLFNTYFFQYVRALGPTVKYIGGQYQYRDHVGDPDARMPFVQIPLEKQQEALDMIIEYALAEDAFELPQEVYQQFGADRWSHWGNSNTYGGRIDYPLHQYLLGVQSSLLEALLDGTRLARIRDTEVKFGEENTITIPELMGTITNAVWSEVWAAPGSNISSNRRDVQRAYLDLMIEIVTDAPSDMPADARSVARAQLSDLNNRITRRLTPPYSFDAYTEAHLREVKARVDKALDAGLSLEN